MSSSPVVGALSKVLAVGTVTGSALGDADGKYTPKISIDTSGVEDVPGDTDPKAVGILEPTIVS